MKLSSWPRARGFLSWLNMEPSGTSVLLVISLEPHTNVVIKLHLLFIPVFVVCDDYHEIVKTINKGYTWKHIKLT